MSNDNIPRVIQRPLPNGVIYDLTDPRTTTITLPPNSTWSSGLHWHERHTEYLKVLRGSIKARVGDEEVIVSATDGEGNDEVKIGRYVWHEWQRASLNGDEVVVQERTDPADGDKALFFWNLNGVILDAPRLLEEGGSFIARCPASFRASLLDIWISLNLFVIFHYLDNIPVMVDVPRRSSGASGLGFLRVLDWAISHTVLFVAAQVGWLLNARPVRLKYTPAREYAAYMARERDGQKTA